MLMHMGRCWHEKLVDLSKDLARLEGGLEKYFSPEVYAAVNAQAERDAENLAAEAKANGPRKRQNKQLSRKKPLPQQRQNRLWKKMPPQKVQQQISSKSRRKKRLTILKENPHGARRPPDIQPPLRDRPNIQRAAALPVDYEKSHQGREPLLVTDCIANCLARDSQSAR